MQSRSAAVTVTSRLAVDDAGADCKRLDGRDDRLEAVAPIAALAGNEPGALAVAGREPLVHHKQIKDRTPMRASR